MISRAALAATAPVPGRIARLHVRGAQITGELLLAHASVQIPLIFEDCVFDEPLDLSHARAESLSLRGCVVPALSAPGLRLDADLNLSGARVGGGR